MGSQIIFSTRRVSTSPPNAQYLKETPTSNSNFETPAEKPQKTQTNPNNVFCSRRSFAQSPYQSDYEDAHSIIFAEEPNYPKQTNGFLGKNTDSNRTNFEKHTGNTFGEFFKLIDGLHEGSEQKKLEAYDLLLQKYADFPENSEILWRLGRSMVIVAELEERQGNKAGKKSNLEKGLQLLEKCLDVNASADAHKWYAIITGMLGPFQTVGEKIKGGYLFKEHIEKAINLRPSESTLYHLLGRWSFEVAQLGWVERKAAAAFFGTPPSATLEEALGCFLKADKLEAKLWKENILWVAKCLVSLKRVPEAVNWIEKALNAGSMESDDPNTIKDLMTLKTKYA